MINHFVDSYLYMNIKHSIVLLKEGIRFDFMIHLQVDKEYAKQSKEL